MTEMAELGIFDYVADPKIEVLNGLVEIAAYLHWSIWKLRGYIRKHGFPAASIGQGNKYLTTKTAINSWIRETHYHSAVKRGWVE